MQIVYRLHPEKYFRQWPERVSVDYIRETPLEKVRSLSRSFKLRKEFDQMVSEKVKVKKLLQADSQK